MKWRRLPRHIAGPIALLAIIWIVFGSLNSSFLSTGNVYAILVSWSTLALVAVGVGIAVVMGEFDLSVGSMAALGGVLAIRFATVGLLPSILIATVPLCVLGAIQGYIIYRLRISSLVFTIGTLILVSGLAYLASGNVTIPLPPDRLGYANSISHPILTVLSPMALVAVVFSLGVWAMMTFTRTGREIYALGGGRSEALAAGVLPAYRFVLAFACSAGASGLAGALASMLSGGASPSNFGDLLLTAVTAALVGGIAVTGGSGSVLGICIGALALETMTAGVALEGYQSYVSDVLAGSLLFCYLALDALLRFLGVRRKPARAFEPSSGILPSEVQADVPPPSQYLGDR
jgi:ribose/xylose/arabinose/galactoside ABC-type transport system permease subunit